MQLEPVSEGPGHRFAGVGNVLVSVYWATPDVSALRERLPWLERTVDRYGSVAILVVICEDADGTLPGKPFRDESKRQADRFREALVLSASAIEGGGVMRTLVRTFLRSLALTAGKDVKVGLFGDVPAAAAWAAEGMAEHAGPDAAALIDAVAGLRP